MILRIIPTVPGKEDKTTMKETTTGGSEANLFF